MSVFPGDRVWCLTGIEWPVVQVLAVEGFFPFAYFFANNDSLIVSNCIACLNYYWLRGPSAAHVSSAIVETGGFLEREQTYTV